MKFLALLGIWLSTALAYWVVFFAAELFAEASTPGDRAAVVFYGFHGHSRGAWLLVPVVAMVLTAAVLIIANLPDDKKK